MAWRRGLWGAALLVLALVSGWVGDAVASVERAPVTQLPPGLVILAQPRTPQGIVKIGLHRIRFLGKVRLVLNEATQAGFPSGGPATSATYPIGSGNRGDGDVSEQLFVGPVAGGRCHLRQFKVIAAVVLRRGLVAWVRVGGTLTRMHTVAIPTAFGVPGPLVYAVLRGWPSATIELRGVHGTDLSHVSLGGGAVCST